MAGGGERLGRLEGEVFNIWMPSWFSNIFNVTLGFLKYFKEF